MKKCKQATTNQKLTGGTIKKYSFSIKKKKKKPTHETPQQQVTHKKVDEETKNL
jgi:hypothetical protein